MSGTLKVTILGSGTSTGVPMIGCRCAVCASNAPENHRTRCSILLVYEGRHILVDTSTDLRQQALREGIDHVDAVLYTHAHADHMHGIDDLRPFNRGASPIPIYGDPVTLQRVRQTFEYIFSDEPDPGFRPRLVTCPVTAPFDLFGLRIDPIPLFHGRGTALGYRIGPFAYLTDCSAIPPASAEALRGVETVIIDGLRFTPHVTHFNIAQAIAQAENLGARRTLLTHLSHDVDHPRHSPQLPPGVEFAFDGQRLEIDLR